MTGDRPIDDTAAEAQSVSCPPTPGHRLAAVVLAAGESSRLGAFKPLLPWPAEDSAETLVAYQVRQLREAGIDSIVVVTGHRAEEVAAAAIAAGARAVHNPQHRAGKATSVWAGVAAAPEGVPLLIVGVDQPRPAWVFRQLANVLFAGHDVVIPTHGGRRGHPALFAARLRGELLAVQEESQGLRAVVQRHAVAAASVTIDSPLVLVNLNTAAEAAEGRRLFAKVSPAAPR